MPDSAPVLRNSDVRCPHGRVTAAGCEPGGKEAPGLDGEFCGSRSRAGIVLIVP